jgi:hypothetical protein
MTIKNYTTSNQHQKQVRIIRRISKKAYGMIQDCTAFWQKLQFFAKTYQDIHELFVNCLLMKKN